MTDRFTCANDAEPIHLWFNLTYANYLVLPRAVLQSAPRQLQARLVRVLEELNEMFGDDYTPPKYRVHCVDERGRYIADPCPHYDRGRTRIAPVAPPARKERRRK